MICPKCGTENENNVQFCKACGSQLMLQQPPQTYGTVQPGVPQSYAAQYTPVEYAGFWRRFAAMIIDGIILGIIGGILGGIVGGILGAGMAVMDADMETIQSLASSVGSLISGVLGWLYFTIFESSSKQATPGKMALGIKVTDMNGGRISFLRANARHWSKLISALIFMIGYFMAAFTEKKQALHDMIAGTLIVK